jgi:hypothetical protein
MSCVAAWLPSVRYELNVLPALEVIGVEGMEGGRSTAVLP